MLFSLVAANKQQVVNRQPQARMTWRCSWPIQAKASSRKDTDSTTAAEIENPAAERASERAGRIRSTAAPGFADQLRQVVQPIALRDSRRIDDVCEIVLGVGEYKRGVFVTRVVIGNR